MCVHVYVCSHEFVCHSHVVYNYEDYWGRGTRTVAPTAVHTGVIREDI